jgi:hypothetical protein
MLVTNFRLKYAWYKLVCAIYQAADIGRIHPARERALRALQRSVDYLERNMPDALGFDSQRELMDYALGTVALDGHYLEFGVFTGGTIRFIARRTAPRLIHGFDSFKGLPEAWSGFNLGRGAFDLKGARPAYRRMFAFTAVISKTACQLGFAKTPSRSPSFTSTATYTAPRRRS